MAGEARKALAYWGLRLWIAGACLLVAAAASAAPAKAAHGLRCPARLSVDAAALHGADMPPGAQLELAAAVLSMFSAGVFSGPPREHAALVPSNADGAHAGDAGVSVWRFDAPDPHGIYLVCAYGPQGHVLLSQRVGQVARCQSTPLRDPQADAGVGAGAVFVCE